MLRRRSGRASERGSVVLSMFVLMILLLLSASLLARSQSQLLASAGSTDAAAAEAGAEQGIAEAIARLDAGERGDFSGTGAIAGGIYRFDAAQVSATSYVVQAEGEIDGVVRAIDVTVGGQPTENLPYTLFINTMASFTDNGRAITGLVGTNGPLAVSGTPPGDTVDLFGPAATCTSCPVTTSFPEQRDVPDPEVPTGTSQTCPRSGRFSGIINGRTGTPFVCDPSSVARSQVTFQNTVTVINGPLIVYVRTGLDIEFRRATVNAGGDPSDFQLTAEGDRDWLDAAGSDISGVLYAPGRDSTLEAVDIFGSFTIGDLTVPAGSGAGMSAPAATGGSDVSGWSVESWERVPAR